MSSRPFASARHAVFTPPRLTPLRHTLRASVFAFNLERIAAHNARGAPYTLGLTPFADLTAEEFLASQAFGARVPTRRRFSVSKDYARVLNGTTRHEGAAGPREAAMASLTPATRRESGPRGHVRRLGTTPASPSITRTPTRSRTQTATPSVSRTPSVTPSSSESPSPSPVFAFDWNACPGPTVVSPVAAQGPCGSCYAFSALGAVESAIAIASNATVVPLSVQHVLDCGAPLTGGCVGL